DLASREDVRAAGGGGMLSAQPEALDQIVNVGEMVVDFSAPQDRKPADHVSKQLEQPPIAGSVDAARPGDRQLHAASIGSLSRHLFAFELRDLVDIAGLERRLF